MAFIPGQFSELTEEDLARLVDGAISETINLEFKSTAYPLGPDGSREFLKDVSALANTNGGTLILGISEEAGVATKITPITESDHDSLKRRLESLLRSGIQPPILGVRMHHVQIDDGYVLSIYVPQSNYPPHRVSAQGKNSFHLRHSTGVYEASMEELRALFSQTVTIRAKLESFRKKRLFMIENGDSAITVAKGDGNLIVHLAPLYSPYGSVNLISAHERNELLRPMHSSGWTPRFNVDGFANIRSGVECAGYTQLFRDGIIEATKIDIIRSRNDERYIWARHIEEILSSSIPLYIKCLENIATPGPWIALISLQGISGSRVCCSIADLDWETPPEIRQKDLLLPPCLIVPSENRSEYIGSLKPALDALWNAGGFAEWSPEQNR
ncbi:ATP-binding protein [Caulobacter segnis]|uniref:ATP-binding protein n=2 Tax=Caulobacter segnis TaxID=88688 RepID=A0ABN5IN75_9CAUL|nr:ATP-binding protein [Caulobacter segnis]ADG08623.1 putative transcriptional regulator [Caulobacter segnis ATCC 21756]AVQ00476.1 ATP-binding protein [Caulobacter segnis]